MYRCLVQSTALGNKYGFLCLFQHAINIDLPCTLMSWWLLLTSASRDKLGSIVARYFWSVRTVTSIWPSGVSWEATELQRIAMEPKHKELLDQCHQNLLESITDADRVIELLMVSGTLSQLDRFELDQNCSSSAEKVDHLLKMLMNKESDHFLDLCVALEKAYPDLYAALFGNNGGGPVDHSTGKSCSKTGFLLKTIKPAADDLCCLYDVGGLAHGDRVWKATQQRGWLLFHH